MTFEPRTLADGHVCCSESYALCDDCREHHGVSDDDYRTTQEHQLRTTEEHRDYPPPDPYREALKAHRATEAGFKRPVTATLPSDGSAPNGYAIAIAALRAKETKS
jgi:hypothetical protein